MAHSEEVFIVSENDNVEEEIFSVAEEMPLPRREDVAPVTPAPVQFPPQNGQRSEQKLDEERGWRSTKDPKDFMEFLQGEIRRIKPQSWQTKSQKERGLAQLKKLDHFMSEALRSDYDDLLNVGSVDDVRKQVEHHIEKTEIALEGIQDMQKNRRKMRRRGEDDPDMVKEGGTPHFNGMNVMISPFERAIVGAIMNGRASGGRDLEELYTDAKAKYDIKPREELAIFQILADMGMPTFRDRLRIGDNEDPTREDGFGEWQSQYYA